MRKWETAVFGGAKAYRGQRCPISGGRVSAWVPLGFDSRTWPHGRDWSSNGSEEQKGIGMKTLLVLSLSLAAVCCAEDKKSEQKKRLTAVTWDLKSHKLVWEVQTGKEQDGEFVASASDRYEISPDQAIMAVSDEKRGFTREEAAALHKLLDTLSLYCAESVVWWDQGQGIKLDKDGKPTDHSKPSETSPEKQRVDEQQPRKLTPTGKTDLVAIMNIVSSNDAAGSGDSGVTVAANESGR